MNIFILSGVWTLSTRVRCTLSMYPSESVFKKSMAWSLLLENHFRPGSSKGFLMKIYTYWVNQQNRPAPLYIRMCIKTWERYLPSAEIIVINHDNVAEYIGNEIDINAFKKLSLPQQSDVVSVAVLSAKGGIFMDADTIVTKDFSSVVLSHQPNAFHAFGYPASNAIHLAVMWCQQPNNPILCQWYSTIIEKMRSLPRYIKWDYVGNSVIKPILNDHDNKACFKIIDRTESGNIVESLHSQHNDAHKAYLDFWFGLTTTTPETIINDAAYGLISLHNSWTPDYFKAFSLDEVVNSNTTLGNLLYFLLKE